VCSSQRVRAQLTESAGWWMLTMNSHGVEFSIAGCVREMVRDPNLLPFLSFFFYHAFIVFRYKKLRAALAMERTKPINQNSQQKKPYTSSSTFLLKVLRPKPFAYRSVETKIKGKLQRYSYFSF